MNTDLIEGKRGDTKSLNKESTEWAEVLLEDVASEITVGYVGPMTSEYIKEGVPFLRSQNVQYLRVSLNEVKHISLKFHHQLKKSTLKPNDVVIVRTGKPGTCTVIPWWLTEANCSDLVIVRCGDKLDPHFLAYYVNSSSSYHVASHLVGAVQQHFNVASARKIRLKLPPFEEQKAISKVLRSLDKKIEVNEQLNKTLEAIGQAVFERWFVDFEFLNQEGNPYKSSGGEMVYRKETGTDLPLDWKTLEVGMLAGVKGRIGWKGYTIEDLTEDGPWVLGGRDLVNNFIDLSKAQHISWNKYDESPDIILKAGDIIFAKTGTIGPIALYDKKIGKATINPNVGIIRSKRINPIFLLFFLKSEYAQHYLKEFITSSVQPAINQATVKKLVVSLPSDNKLQVKIDSVLVSIYSKQVQLKHENDLLNGIRNSLLPKLLSGKIRVPIKENNEDVLNV